MATAVLDLPKDVCSPVQLGSLGAFFNTSPSSDEVLGSTEERLINSLTNALDRYLLAVIDSRDVAEFRRERKKSWPKYARALRALQDTFANLVPEAVLVQVSKQAMISLENDIQRQGMTVFGSTLTDQALFTLWTIGEIRTLGQEIASMDVAASIQKKDLELAREYYLDSLWAQFHLDSLVAALKFQRPVSEEIRSEVCDGLRTAVNAYAVMKDAATLRQSSIVESLAPANLPWDEEDNGLLASSMRDINVDFSEDS